MYKLLTPGPLTTSKTVKEEMLFDHCTWDKSYNNITQEIRSELLKISDLSADDYTAILMQGSGTAGVESVLTSVVDQNESVLVLSNGAYGERIDSILDYAKIEHETIFYPYDHQITGDDAKRGLAENPDVNYVIVVHCETTSGILNDIESISKVVKDLGKYYIVDAMSSFGGVPIDIAELGIDYLISSVNKCIQGVPGFSFVIAKKSHFLKTKGRARSLALDLYDQWETMDENGKWRFTSPTHVILAFRQALREFNEEGGIQARYKRYSNNMDKLITGMENLGFDLYLDKTVQGPIIASFLYPENADFNFNDLYEALKEGGYVIYPGKLTDLDTFRLGVIGEIYPDDIDRVVELFKKHIEGE